MPSCRTMRACGGDEQKPGTSGLRVRSQSPERRSRQDADHGHVARIHAQHKDDADEVPDDAVDLGLFALAHERPEDALVPPRKGGVVQADIVDGRHGDEAGGEQCDQGAACRGVQVVETDGEEAWGAASWIS